MSIYKMFIQSSISALMITAFVEAKLPIAPKTIPRMVTKIQVKRFKKPHFLPNNVRKNKGGRTRLIRLPRILPTKLTSRPNCGTNTAINRHVTKTTERERNNHAQ